MVSSERLGATLDLPGAMWLTEASEPPYPTPGQLHCRTGHYPQLGFRRMFCFESCSLHFRTDLFHSVSPFSWALAPTGMPYLGTSSVLIVYSSFSSCTVSSGGREGFPLRNRFLRLTQCFCKQPSHSAPVLNDGKMRFSGGISLQIYQLNLVPKSASYIPPLFQIQNLFF